MRHAPNVMRHGAYPAYSALPDTDASMTHDA